MTHPVDIYVGQRVRARRSELGITQTQTGDYMGLTFQQIQKYEKGSNRISASRLYGLSQLLRVTPQYFFDGYGKDQQALSNREMRQAMSLSKWFSRIASPQLRNVIIEHTHMLANMKD